MNISSEKSDARSITRSKIMHTFNRLLLDSGAPRPKVAQIISEADVSRSTFYDHFDGVEVLMNDSLEQWFDGFSAALLHQPDIATLTHLIEHVGENRRMAREFLSGDRGDRAQALFARVLERHLHGREDARFSALLISGSILTALQTWSAGRISITASELANRLSATADAILERDK